MRLFSQIIFIVIVSLLSFSCFAKEVLYSDEIVLLALRESGDDKSGTVAKLKLDVVPGEERVYLETYPLTKVSTQASLRFAQQVACKELEVDCSMYDFLFSLEALPGIIGGPSAGSAATLLVAGAMLKLPIPKDVAITGTINSGGTIGPVGGLKQKVEAAASNGVNIVLLPRGTSDFKEDNVSIDLIEFGKSLNLSVLEISTIREVLALVLNVSKNVSDEPLSIAPSYEKTMKLVSEDLCEKTAKFEKSGLNFSAGNLSSRAKDAFGRGAFYSAASFCFRANVAFAEEELKLANFSKENIAKLLLDIRNDAEMFLNETNNRKIETLTDIQTYMAVRERIEESIKAVREGAQNIVENGSGVSDAAFASERLFSAKVWSRFFGIDNKGAFIDGDNLKSACAEKIAEAEERFNYVVSVLPDAIPATRKDIDNAYQLLGKGDYIMCLYTAAKAKAEGDVLLNLMGVEEDRFDEVIGLKLKIAREELLRAQKKGAFPIIAYSYYEYASSLVGYDNVSALLFAEYALELASFDMYFKGKLNSELNVGIETFSVPSKVIAFLSGILIGALVITIGLQISWNNFQKKKVKVSKLGRGLFAGKVKTQSDRPKGSPKGKKR